MTRVPPATYRPIDPLDRPFIESERNRLGSRALSSLVLLNGGAALVLLTLSAMAQAGTVNSKIAAAMLFFGAGALAGLLSAFFAYVNRTVEVEAPERRPLRFALRILAIVAVLGSGVAFMTGLNMVASASGEKSSSHPKSSRERPTQTGPKERVHLQNEAELPSRTRS